MFEEEFCNRLIQLRLKKGISARDMSLSIGQSESYINRIENKKMLPSMTVFFYICDFFRITPKEFFSFESTSDLDVIHAMKKLSALDEKKKEHVIAIIEDLSP